MRALEFITGHVIYNPAYTYKFQLKTTNDILQHNYWPLPQTITTNNNKKNPNPCFQDGERFNLSANDPIFWSPRPQKRRRNQKGRIWS